MLMKKLAKDGMTMAVVTHEMGFAREVASQSSLSWMKERSRKRIHQMNSLHTRRIRDCRSSYQKYCNRKQAMTGKGHCLFYLQEITFM